MEGLLNILLLDQLMNVNERHRLRIERGQLRDVSDPFQLNEDVFIKYFRLSRNITLNLINLLEPHVQQPARGTGVPLQLKVLSVLYFLGHGSYQKCVGLNLNTAMDQSTFSKILAEITDALVEHLLADWVVFPQTPAQFNEIKNGFMEKFQFPGIVGAFDCTHVSIIAPPQDDPIYPGLSYYNRKGYYSINVQLICDSNLRVLNCNARFPGTVHESAIWSLSQVKHYLQHLYNNNRQIQSTWLIGDSGYPLEPWLLTPVEGAMPNTPEGHYINAHTSARNTIERLNGVLKGRFRCLMKHRALHYTPTRASKIILAAVILHNMSLNDRLPPDEDEGNNDQFLDEPPIEKQHQFQNNIIGNVLNEARQTEVGLFFNTFNKHILYKHCK